MAVQDLKETAPCGMKIRYTVDSSTDMVTYTDINGRGEDNLQKACEHCSWRSICKPTSIKEICKDAGTNMNEKDYQKLAGLSDTTHMSDAEAQIFISKELGFSAEKVKIVRTVKTYYVEDRRIKVLNEYTREPVYNSTDWNYIRFDVCGWQYELVNGDLRFYES